MTGNVAISAGSDDVRWRDRSTFRRRQQVLCCALEPTRTPYRNAMALQELLGRSGPHRLLTVKATPVLRSVFLHSNFLDLFGHFDLAGFDKNREPGAKVLCTSRAMPLRFSALALPHGHTLLGNEPRNYFVRYFGFCQPWSEVSNFHGVNPRNHNRHLSCCSYHHLSASVFTLRQIKQAVSGQAVSNPRAVWPGPPSDSAAQHLFVRRRHPGCTARIGPVTGSRSRCSHPACRAGG